MPKGKLKSYVGFALRSNSTTFGLENVKKSFKKVFCVLFDEGLSENTKKQVQNFCNEKKIKLKQLKSIDSVFNTTNCKIVGITNKELSKQILECEE